MSSINPENIYRTTLEIGQIGGINPDKIYRTTREIRQIGGMESFPEVTQEITLPEDEDNVLRKPVDDLADQVAMQFPEINLDIALSGYEVVDNVSRKLIKLPEVELNTASSECEEKEVLPKRLWRPVSDLTNRVSVASVKPMIKFPEVKLNVSASEYQDKENVPRRLGESVRKLANLVSVPVKPAASKVPVRVAKAWSNYPKAIEIAGVAPKSPIKVVEKPCNCPKAIAVASKVPKKVVAMPSNCPKAIAVASKVPEKVVAMPSNCPKAIAVASKVPMRVVAMPSNCPKAIAVGSKVPTRLTETPSNDPKTIEMIVEAVYTLGNENKEGVSVESIKKWIRVRYPDISTIRLGKIFLKSLRSALDADMLAIHPKPEEAVPPLLKARYRLSGNVQIVDGIIKVRAANIKAKPAAKAMAKPVSKPKAVSEAPKEKSKTAASKAKDVPAVKVPGKAKKKAVCVSSAKKKAVKTKYIAVSTGVSSARKKKAVKTLGSAIARCKTGELPTPRILVASIVAQKSNLKNLVG